MKKTATILLSLFLFLLVFWLGFMGNFPGAALSRMVAARIAKHAGLAAEVGPARLGWGGVTFPSVALRKPGPGPASPAISLKEVTVPITWRLWSGVPVQGRLGTGGWFDLSLAWNGTELELHDLVIPLQDLPPLPALKNIGLRGTVSASGSLRFPGGIAKSPLAPFPVGTLRGSGRAVEVSKLVVLGNEIPTTRLKQIDFRIKSGRSIEVEQLEFSGDLRGSLKGSITPRRRNPASSPLRLSLTATFRDGWLAQLGQLRPLAESFLSNGRLRADVRGTIGSPRLNRK